MNLPDLETLAEPHRPADPADLRIRWQCRGCPWWYVQPGTRGVSTARLSSTDVRTRETDGGSGRAALILVSKHVSEAHPLTFRELATSGREPAEVWEAAAAGPCGRGCGGDTHDGAPDSCPGHTAA